MVERHGCKAQSGMETFVVALLIVLLMLYGFTTYAQRNTEIQKSQISMDAQRECYRVSMLINRVRSNGAGFRERASFDTNVVRIFGNSHGIEVELNGGAAVGTDNYFCTFLTSNVTNSTHFNFDLSGDYDIINDGTNVTFYEIT